MGTSALFLPPRGVILPETQCLFAWSKDIDYYPLIFNSQKGISPHPHLAPQPPVNPASGVSEQVLVL